MKNKGLTAVFFNLSSSEATYNKDARASDFSSKYAKEKLVSAKKQGYDYGVILRVFLSGNTTLNTCFYLD